MHASLLNSKDQILIRDYEATLAVAVKFRNFPLSYPNCLVESYDSLSFAGKAMFFSDFGTPFASRFFVSLRPMRPRPAAPGNGASRESGRDMHLPPPGLEMAAGKINWGGKRNGWIARSLAVITNYQKTRIVIVIICITKRAVLGGEIPGEAGIYGIEKASAPEEKCASAGSGGLRIGAGT